MVKYFKINLYFIKRLLIIIYPNLILWIIIYPCISLAVLFKKRKKLNQLNVRAKLGYYIEGYKKQYFYWYSIHSYKNIYIFSVGNFALCTEKYYTYRSTYLKGCLT